MMRICFALALLLFCDYAASQVHPKTSGFAERMETLRLRIMFGPPSLGQVQLAVEKVMNKLEHVHRDSERPEDFEDLTEDPCDFISELVMKTAVNTECGRDLNFFCQSVRKLTGAVMESCPGRCQCNATCTCEKNKAKVISDHFWAAEGEPI